MKKLLLCLCTLILLAGCANNAAPAQADVSPSEEMQEHFLSLTKAVETLLEEYDLPDVIACKGSTETAACYGFRDAALHDGWVRSSSYALEAFEIALFHAKSEANVTIIEEKLRTYLDELEQKYAGYAPQTAALIRRAELVTHGSFCALIVCEESLQAELLTLINTEFPG